MGAIPISATLGKNEGFGSSYLPSVVFQFNDTKLGLTDWPRGKAAVSKTAHGGSNPSSVATR
jgi:hypothetical protein